MTGNESTPIAAQPFHDQIRDGRIEHIASLIGGAVPNYYNNKLLSKLTDFSEATLDLIEASADEGYTLDVVTFIASPESAVREATFYLPRFTRDVSKYEVREITNGLHYLDRYRNVEKLDELTGTELDIASAFLNVTSALYEHASADHVVIAYHKGESAGHISEPALQELVATYYQQADMIISYIVDRGSADPDAVREYLENETVLKGGVL